MSQSLLHSFKASRIVLMVIGFAILSGFGICGCHSESQDAADHRPAYTPPANAQPPVVPPKTKKNDI